MAAYVASKHAVEGYSESLDHEVREHGVRVLLVEPANTNTGFDTNMVRADTPLVYAQHRHTFDEVMAGLIKDGDQPAAVAKVIVAAATDRSRNCATPPAPEPDASTRAASSPPAPSTDRSANSTS